jgi:hypothetical protein
VEDILIKDRRFHQPGKKALRPSETLIEVVLIDATECPCERPKKNYVGKVSLSRLLKSPTMEASRLAV